MSKEDIYIDDTPSDFSSALSFNSDEDYEKYREKRRKEIKEKANKNK